MGIGVRRHASVGDEGPPPTHRPVWSARSMAKNASPARSAKKHAQGGEEGGRGSCQIGPLTEPGQGAATRRPARRLLPAAHGACAGGPRLPRPRRPLHPSRHHPRYRCRWGARTPIDGPPPDAKGHVCSHSRRQPPRLAGRGRPRKSGRQHHRSQRLLAQRQWYCLRPQCQVGCTHPAEKGDAIEEIQDERQQQETQQKSEPHR